MKIKLFIIFLVLLMSNILKAGDIRYTAVIPNNVPNWSKTVSVPMFNPALGILDSVTVGLITDFGMIFKYENLSSSESEIEYQGKIVETLSLNNKVLNTNVINNWYFDNTLSGYDGTLDFGGSSGFTFSQDSNSFSLVTLNSNLAPFIGSNNIDLIVTASNRTMRIYSGGNSKSISESEAGAGVEINYHYTSSVPEPTTIIGLISGIGILYNYTRKRIKVIE